MTYIKSKGYKRCPKCGQPVLKKGQKRKHPDDYRHATGCPAAPKVERRMWGVKWKKVVNKLPLGKGEK